MDGQQPLDVAKKNTRRTRLCSTAGVKLSGAGDAEQLLGFDVVFGAQRLLKSGASAPADARDDVHVISGASFGISEDMVCHGRRTKPSASPVDSLSGWNR